MGIRILRYKGKLKDEGRIIFRSNYGKCLLCLKLQSYGIQWTPTEYKCFGLIIRYDMVSIKLLVSVITGQNFRDLECLRDIRLLNNLRFVKRMIGSI